jgi:hypothetical protein
MAEDAQNATEDHGKKHEAPTTPDILTGSLAGAATGFTAVAAAFGLAAYACGLIIVCVQSFISGFGDVDFLRARYVTVGMCFLVVLMLSTAPAYAAGRWSTRLVHEHGRLRQALLMTVLLLALAVAVPRLMLLAIMPTHMSCAQCSSLMLRWFLPVIALSLSSGIAIEIARLGAEEARRTKARRVVWATCRFCVHIMLPLFFVCAIGFYARSIYPNVEMAYGGGSSPVAQLTACTDDPKKAELFERLVYHYGGHGAFTTRILEKDAEHYLLRVGTRVQAADTSWTDEASDLFTVSIPADVVCGVCFPSGPQADCSTEDSRRESPFAPPGAP